MVGEWLRSGETPDDEPPIALILQPIDSRDVGVVQRGEKLGFTLKASQAFGIGGEVLGENLDGDIAVKLRIPRPIHLSHAALAERFKDLVMTEGFTDHGG